MKSFISFFSLLFFLPVFAQQNKMNFRDPEGVVSEIKSKKPTDIPSKATVLYSNDFSIPSQWSLSNTSVPSADWLITTNLNLAPFAYFRPAGFLTGYNGYAIIDSDAQGGSAQQDAYISLNPRITSCASQPYVILEFSQMYTSFNDTTSVEVSNNGTTWTEFIVNDAVPNSVNSPNPQKVTVNISNVASFQDSVYIRFRYRATNAWFWAIDDVKIRTQDEFDLVGEEIMFGSTGNWGMRLPYRQVPLAQIQPIQITGRIRNAGFAYQGNVEIIGSGSGYSGGTPLLVMPPNVSGNFDLSPSWTPAAIIGPKSVNFVVESPETDIIPANNNLESLELDITETIYTRDELVRTGRISNGAFTLSYEAGNVFDIFANAEISSAMVHVAKESSGNVKMFVKLYEAISATNFNYLGGSDTMIVAALSHDSLFKIKLQQPITLQAGKSYLLTAGSTGSPNFPGLVLGTSGQPELFTSFFATSNAGSWSSLTEIPMVRMNFESVAELEGKIANLQQIQLFPNPANNAFHLSFSLSTSEIVKIQVFDLQGREVKEEKLLGKVGENNVNCSVQNVNKGIYTVKITTNSDQNTVVLRIE